MIEGWIWEWFLAWFPGGSKRVFTDKELKMAQSFKEWLELDVIEREKRKAAMTDEERKELKASESAFYDQQEKF